VTRASSAIGFAIVLAASPLAQRDSWIGIADLLDAYARGEFTSAVKAGAALPELPGWRQSYPRVARAWIDQSVSPSDVSRRRLVAAGLALEVTRERYERDATIWTALRPVVDWTCEELRQEPNPPDGEQAWQRASVALGQRLLNSSWLAMGPAGGNHLEHAWLRFPHDPRFALASLALATRSADRDVGQREKRITEDKRLVITTLPPSFGGDRVSGPASGMPSTVRNSDAPDPRLESRQAIASFDRLLGHPEVGADAEAHVSHLYLTLHEWKPALEHARNAARLATDTRPRYLGFLMAGLALEQLGQRDEARISYWQALDSLPTGQTAALLLASLNEDGGTIPQTVAALVSRSLAPPGRDDPWRLYYYGDYFNWPTYIEQLHEALR
jgi:tetratricopeptide (TPR) repeat protein